MATDGGSKPTKTLRGVTYLIGRGEPPRERRHRSAVLTSPKASRRVPRAAQPLPASTTRVRHACGRSLSDPQSYSPQRQLPPHTERRVSPSLDSEQTEP